MEVVVYSNPVFNKHETGASHPESTKRIDVLSQGFHNLPSKVTLKQEWDELPDAWIRKVHDPRLVELVDKLAQNGGGEIDADTIVSQNSAELARKAVGAGLVAIDQVISSTVPRAAVFARPPGHHATPKKSMGFCLFNNIAVAAKYALERYELSKILIVDWDVHHGNGTQDVFYDDDRVFFLSVHRYPYYPGTGSQSETGTRQGLGYTHNVPIYDHLDRQTSLSKFKSAFDLIFDKFKPELIMISAGYDGHRLDPLGSFGWESHDYFDLTRHIEQASEVFGKGRVVSFLEGGYHLDALLQSSLLHIDAMSQAGPSI